MNITLTRLDNGRDAKCGADSLSQKDLIVLGADGGHHDAKDMEEGSHKDEMARTIIVVEFSDDGTLRESGDGKEKIQVKHTIAIMKKICSEGIQAIVLDE